MGEQIPMTFAARDAGVMPLVSLMLLSDSCNEHDAVYVQCNGQGRPQQGEVEVDNLRCNSNQVINGVAVCEDGRLMKLLPPGLLQRNSS